MCSAASRRARGPGRGMTRPPAGEVTAHDACDVFVTDHAKVERVRSALIGAGRVGALAETFRALGDPTRVRILDALSRAELCVCDLATLLGLSPSAVSHQLRLLRGMRLVRSRRAGRMVFYTLDDQHIVALFHQGLRHVDEGVGNAAPARAARDAARGSGRGER
jgi:ArsR family transcriptional regulator, lead/cadmium/zinc/bismuth-responsive transcriptional repressor